ncbi:MAG TPA: tetratricopeptide repeat protein [Terriglobales bacterium]|nr:tetratricopeptide repeat protein [Terriglobales bacterium]
MRRCVFLVTLLFSFFALGQELPSNPVPQSSTNKSAQATKAGGQTPLAPPNAAKEAADYSQQPFVIEKFVNRIRFENDGTSEREQTTRIRVQTQAGVQAFGQLHFAYDSGSDQIDIVLVKVTKPNGAVTTAGADSVQDLTAPVAREAPVYSDLHQKDVIVPGLAAGDVLEYDVRTKTVQPLAPGQFWWEQEFIRHVIVLDEQLIVNVPAGRELKMHNKSIQPQIATADGRTTYLWKNSVLKLDDDDLGINKKHKKKQPTDEEDEIPDVQLSTFQSWDQVGRWYSSLERDRVKPDSQVRSKAEELTASAKSDTQKIEALYDFVAPRYRYVGISFGVGRFQPHAASDVLNNRYGDCKDKHTLLASLIKAIGLDAYPVLIHHARKLDESVPSPAQFDHVITFVPMKNGPDKAGTMQGIWLDSTTEVAPFRMLAASIRNKKALLIPPNASAQIVTTPADLPFGNTQTVKVTASINKIGKLEASYDYIVRGDAELAFRVAFRGTPETQWKRVIEYLDAYEGLNGDVDDVKVSDPADTHHPLEFSYKLTAANYLDWTTKSSQLAIPLPRLDMSWANLNDDDEDRTKPYEFPSAPLESNATVKLDLPDGYTYRSPVPIQVKRDYASFDSEYKLDGHTLTVQKDLSLSMRQIDAGRGPDLRAFVRAVAADSNQSVFVENQSQASGSNIPAGMSADDLNDAGIAALKSQNFREAVDLLKKVVELEPKHKDSWNALGQAYLSLGKYDDAADAFRKQVENNQFDESAYNNLGLALQAEQKYDEAIAAYKKQLEVNPLDQFAHGNLGALYLEQKDYSDAAPELERAVQITPQNPTLEANLGRVYLNTNQPDKALTAFDKAVELAPSPLIWNNVAYELSTHKTHLDRALTYAESATTATEAGLRNVDLDHLTLNDLGITMSIGSYWDTLGWVYFQDNQLEKAKRYIEAAWLLDEHSEIGDHLGQLYEKMGRKQEAIHYYALAVTANHKVPEAEQHLKSLLPDAKQDQTAVNEAKAEIPKLRSVHLPWSGTKAAKGEFFLTFTVSAHPSRGTKPDQVKFVSGDESLRSYVTQLQAADFDVEFPDDTPIKLVRRGVLSCDGQSKECQLLLMLPEDVRTVD